MRDSLATVEPAARAAITESGDRIAFDALVLATGAIPREPLPGALTFRGRGDVLALRSLLDELVSGRAKSVALALPSQRTWPLSLYELAMMTSAHLSEHGVEGVPVTVVTPEEEPLELFGSAAGIAIRELLAARRIVLRTSSLPARVHRRVLGLAGGGEVFVDRVVTLPVPEGPAVSGVPHDEHGFVPVDAFGRVSGLGSVYAAGDLTTLPLKQGGLAAQQADAVAETIAAELGVPIDPKPSRRCFAGCC